MRCEVSFETSPISKFMTALAPHMDKTKFVRWMVKGSDSPLRWDDALRRCDNPYSFGVPYRVPA